ncbi:MAG: helix-turn-helix transcriptional regulator [Plesiomonas sp.]
MTRILRRKEVCEKLGISRSTLYNWLSPNSAYFVIDLPKPIRLGTTRTIGWISDEIEHWINSRAKHTNILPGKKQT